MADPYQFDSDGNLILDLENVKDAADLQRQEAAASAWKAAQANRAFPMPYGPGYVKTPAPDLPGTRRTVSAWQEVPQVPAQSPRVDPYVNFANKATGKPYK